MSVGTKFCRKCQRLLPEDHFPQAQRQDLKRWCKECLREPVLPAQPYIYIANAPEKFCRGCNEMRPLEEFAYRSHTPPSKEPFCYDCHQRFFGTNSTTTNRRVRHGKLEEG